MQRASDSRLLLKDRIHHNPLGRFFLDWARFLKVQIGAILAKTKATFNLSSPCSTTSICAAKFSVGIKLTSRRIERRKLKD